MMNKFFVYGTLQVGGVFAGRFDEYRKKSTKATLEGYDMYGINRTLEDSWYPLIVEGANTVHGELHEYNEDDMPFLLYQMDRIEGYNPKVDGDTNLYLRKEVTVKLEDGSTEQAYVYIFNRQPTDRNVKIESGVFPVNCAANSTGL